MNAPSTSVPRARAGITTRPTLAQTAEHYRGLGERARKLNETARPQPATRERRRTQ